MIRGIDSTQEAAARQLARDTRPLGQRIAIFVSKPEFIVLLCGMSIACTFIYPLATDIVFLLCTAFFLFALTRKTTLPFRIPRSAKLKDYNDPIPGTNKPKIGEGIAYFGNDRITREELWFSNDDLRTHVLIFGSTGSGKTEALISIAFNALLYGSGFIYIDGKGDNSLFAKVFSMVRSMGREDDMLLVNFMTGARDIIGPQKSRLSNTMNPFSRGSSSMLSQLVVSIMSSGKQGGGNDDMWTGRAINFVESLMKVLTAMRDAGHILLDANSIRDYFILEKLEQIVIDKRFPVSDTYSVPLDAFPPQILEPLAAYILNLPGYNRQKKGNQGSEVREQHGFITMQLTRAFGSLADTYGHIIRTNLAEVDFKDVVLNRRILVVLLPALEKSPQELSNLGKIIVASLKAMMASGLGEEVEGDYRDVILRKPTNSPTPFICIMDEYGYYAVEGFAVVPAQARSLGFSAVFAGQDLPAFQKASKEEAASIGANCNVKICMKLEDPQETWEYFNKVAGEAYVTSVSGFQMDSGSLTMNYMDTRNASIDKRQRIDLLDLKEQKPGEAHVFFKSKIIRAEMFYASPKPVKKMRVNQYLKIEPPSEEKTFEMLKRFKRFQQVFVSPHYQMPQPIESNDIKIIAEAFQGAINLKPFERGIAALIALLEQEVQKQRDLSVPFEEPGFEHEMSAFTKVFTNDLVLRMIGMENKDLFELPLIRRGNTAEEMKHIERLCGKPEPEAMKIANSLIRDIEVATKFPPEVYIERDIKGLVQDISDLIVLFGGGAIDAGALQQEARAKAALSSGGYASHEHDLPEFPDLSDLNDFESFDMFNKDLDLEDKVQNEDEEEAVAPEVQHPEDYLTFPEEPLINPKDESREDKG
jgi:intracellular multiplication protein IcmO